MTASAPLLALGFVALSLGCAPAAVPTGPSFAFEADGQRYEIVALRPASGSVNDLLRYDGGRVVLRARDRDQDGTLDTLLVGDVPLAGANAIYAQGIETARARGQARQKEPERTYVHVALGERLVLWSVAEGGSAWHNRFVRVGRDGQPGIVYLDTDADGRLDDGAPDSAQASYALALDAGRREGKVEVVGSRLRISPRPPDV